jgi:hypothetical protein
MPGALGAVASRSRMGRATAAPVVDSDAGSGG